MPTESFDCISANSLELLKLRQRLPESFPYFAPLTALLFRKAGAYLKTAIKGA